MVLSVEFGDGTRQDSSFALISKSKEAKLKADLAEADKLPAGITKGLLRAVILHDAGLLNAVADELESTRQIAPESVDLIKATIFAEYEVGNVHRALELQKMLPEADQAKE